MIKYWSLKKITSATAGIRKGLIRDVAEVIRHTPENKKREVIRMIRNSAKALKFHIGAEK
jgi:hypothetical protein